MMKGFRFHPTDEELIEFLQIKTFDRDSLVQVIDEIPDICELEPWELPGRSRLQTGDRLWYFMYPPKYKYRNSKRISRTTREGYWKPTGNARKIIDSNTGVVIGSKKTLVFYKGQCNEKNKNKSCWVIHEYELKVVPKLISESNQDQIKSFNLCKLKKKMDISSNSDEASQSSQHSLSNLENNVANYAMVEDWLNPDWSSEPEASNVSGIVHNPASSFETFAGERSNQHNVVNDDEGSNLSSNFIHHVAEDAIPKEPLDLKEVPTERNGPNDNDWLQNLNSTIEQDNQSCNSVLTNNDESVPIERSNQHNIVVAAESFPLERSNQHNIVDTAGSVTIERSNQHNIVAAAEGFKWPSSPKYLAEEDLIPTVLLYNDTDGLSLDELLDETKATNNSNWIQNQYITSIEDGELLNSNFAENSNNKVYLEEENTEQCLAANDEGFSLPCIDMMESSNSMEKSRKRSRLQ